MTPREHALALVEEGMELLRRNLKEAQRKAVVAQRLAAKSRDAEAQGQAERLLGHVALLQGSPLRALPHYEASRRWFGQAGLAEEAAITASGSVQALIYAGRTEDAFAAAEEAEAVLRAAGNTFRLARLQVNVANALHRLERADEALPRYEEALAILQEFGAHQDAAIVMRNLAVCLMALHRLDDAAARYAQAKAYFREHGLTLLEWEVESNEAYLWGRRGEYRRALGQYRRILRHRGSEGWSGAGFEIGNALLDQAEFMVEVGLFADGAEAARESERIFRRLRLGVEVGKAQLLVVLAEVSGGQREGAKTRLTAARRRLEKGGNPVWVALCDQLLGRLDREAGNLKGALVHQRQAMARLESAGSAERLALGRLMLAEAALAAGDSEAAEAALDRAGPNLEPPLALEAESLRAAVAEARGDLAGARAAGQRAMELAEYARVELGAPGLMAAFQGRRAGLFERAYRLAESVEVRFEVVQRAKARTLHDLVVARWQASVETAGRQELRFIQHELASQDLEAGTEQLRDRLRARRLELERRLGQEHRFAGVEEGSALLAVPSLAEVAACEVALVEMFAVGGELRALVLGGGGVEERSLGAVADFERLGRRLLFHLGRGLRDPAGQLGRAESERLLGELGLRLREGLGGAEREVVMLPHGPLHGLPLAAALEQVGVERVTRAPSAAVWLRLRERATESGPALVLAASDALAPQIREEARAVGATLGAEVREGDAAGLEALREAGARARVIHVASHGLFREDQPLFSALRLGSDEVCALDIAQLRLGAEVVSLSGCSTGLAMLNPAEEQIGLVQSFLVAGARAVVASLWEAHDGATAAFFATFYAEWAKTQEGAGALAAGRAAARLEVGHPAAWAPFEFFGAEAKKGVSGADVAAPRRVEEA